MPSTIYNSNFEFVQTPQAILIHTELGGGFRIIALDGRPRLPDAICFWQGNSRGHWEGDPPGPLDHVEVGAGAAKFAPTDEFPSRSRDEPGRCKDRVAGT